MVRVIIVFLAAMLISESSARAAENPDVERVRADMVVFFKQSHIDEDLRARFIDLIKDDKKPIDMKEVTNLFSLANPSARDKMLQVGFLHVIPFRDRDDPKFLVSFYDQLPEQYQHLYFWIFLVHYDRLVTPDLSELGKKVLLSELPKCSTDNKDPKVLEGHEMVCQAAIEFMIKANADVSMPFLAEVLKDDVSSQEVRFNLVAETISDGKEKAVEIGRWYFRDYCCTPFETKVLVDYLKKYLNDVPLQGDLKQKRDQLQQSLDEVR